MARIQFRETLAPSSPAAGGTGTEFRGLPALAAGNYSEGR